MLSKLPSVKILNFIGKWTYASFTFFFDSIDLTFELSSTIPFAYKIENGTCVPASIVFLIHLKAKQGGQNNTREVKRKTKTTQLDFNTSAGTQRFCNVHTTFLTFK